jgi:hypothetical protein
MRSGKFRKVIETEAVRGEIKNSLRAASSACTSLLQGKFSGSTRSGTSLEALDIIRASWLSYHDEFDEIYIKNSLLHLVENGTRSHHSLCAWLSLFLVGQETSIDIKEIMLASRSVTRKECDRFYEAIIRDGRTSSLFEEMLQRAGTSSQIMIQSTPSKNDDVIHRKNHQYPLGIPQEFTRAGKSKIEAYDCKVLVVDGVIMTVGEVHRFLTAFHESRENLLLVCRGLSTEVLSTLIRNFVEGRLNIYPVQVPPAEYANILHDIAHLSGASIVSTITGDVLAAKDEECLGSVSNVKMTSSSLEFECSDVDRKNELVKKIERERKDLIEEFGAVNEASDIIDMRKSCAAAESCSVYVSKFGVGQEEIICDRLKSLTKIHGEFKERGCVDIDVLGPAFAPLKKAGIDFLPTSSVIYAIKSASDTRDKLLSSRVIMVKD